MESTAYHATRTQFMLPFGFSILDFLGDGDIRIVDWIRIVQEGDTRTKIYVHLTMRCKRSREKRRAKTWQEVRLQNDVLIQIRDERIDDRQRAAISPGLLAALASSALVAIQDLRDSCAQNMME